MNVSKLTLSGRTGLAQVWEAVLGKVTGRERRKETGDGPAVGSRL